MDRILQGVMKICITGYGDYTTGWDDNVQQAVVTVIQGVITLLQGVITLYYGCGDTVLQGMVTVNGYYMVGGQ